MTKEQAIILCNKIQAEDIIGYNEHTGFIAKETPINTLLQFLGKNFKIGGDSRGWYESDIKRTVSFLREIADALEQ